jgi:hypothetical protein
MRVSEIFEALVGGAASKARPLAAEGGVAPGRTEEPFELVFFGIGPVAAAAAPESWQAEGSATPQFQGMAFAAPAGLLAAEDEGGLAAGDASAAAVPTLLPVPDRVLVGAAAVLEDALAEALALRRLAEAGTEAAIGPLAGQTASLPPLLPAPRELGATAGGEARAGLAMSPGRTPPGVLAGAAQTAVPVPAAAGQVPGSPQPPAHVTQDATAAPMGRVPWTEALETFAAAPSTEPAAARGADVLAPGTESVESLGEPSFRPAVPEGRGADATAGTLPPLSDHAPAPTSVDLPARGRHEAAMPGRRLGVGMQAEPAPLAPIAVSPEPAVASGAPGDRRVWIAAPQAEAELPGANAGRAAETAVPASLWPGAAQGRAIASGPVREDGAPAPVGRPDVAPSAEPGSAGPATPSGTARDAPHGGPGRETAGSPLPPNGGAGANPVAPPADAVAASALSIFGRESNAALAGAGGTKGMPPAAEVHRAAGVEAPTMPDSAPVAIGAEASERGTATAGPGAISDLPPAAAHGIGEAPLGLRDSATAPHAAPEARAEIGARAAQQVAAALTASPEGRIELRLDPEELGPVRLGLLPGDGTITVQIAAERGETLELLRRHADLLARELRQAGYGEVSFQFGADTASGGGAAPRDGYAPTDAREANETAPGDPEAAPAAPTPFARRDHAARALDLRL